MRKLIAAAAFALGVGFAAAGAQAQAQTTVLLAAAMQPPAVTHSFLIGRWTDNGDCSNNVEFFADGRFVTSDGARGRWTIEGDRLSFVGNSTVTARVRATSRDAIELTHADGSTGGSTRCGAARRIAMPALPATAAEILRIGTPVSRQMLIGRWTDSGDCGVAIDFFSDGRFTVPTGGGRWTLTGDQLSFIGSSTVTARVRAAGRDRILLIHGDGRLGQSVRC
jgi:hypothetical protein